MAKSYLLSRQAIWIVLGCLVCQAGAGLFYASRALAPDVIGELGWTRTMWSSAMAPMIFVTSVLQAVIGAACVRYGIRPVLVVSVLSLGVTFFVMAGMYSLPVFYLATMFLAIGNAGIGDVSVGAVITRWFDRSRGVALGFAFAGSNIGAVFFVHAVTEWTGLFGWRGASIALGAVSIVAILPFALFVVRDPRAGEGEQTASTAAPGEVSAGIRRVDAPEPAGDDDVDLRQALRSPAFWILFFTIFCYAVAQLGMLDHLILHLVDLGYERGEAANALELTVGAGILAKVSAGTIALRIRTRHLLVANTALLALGVALLPFAADPRILAVSGVAFGIATSARDVLIPLATAEFFGARHFAAIYGMMMLAYFPGGGLGPIVLARAYDVLGSYESGFAVFLGILVLALIGQVFAARRSFGIRMPAAG
ncbi:MAG: MFS transporter [Deltaproteobacteria bacterium]|nr:MFS transporter [Deltaproteobacteria bacterium]